MKLYKANIIHLTPTESVFYNCYQTRFTHPMCSKPRAETLRFAAKSLFTLQPREEMGELIPNPPLQKRGAWDNCGMELWCVWSPGKGEWKWGKGVIIIVLCRHNQATGFFLAHMPRTFGVTMFWGWSSWPSDVKGHREDTGTCPVRGSVVLGSLKQLKLDTADSKFLKKQLGQTSYYLCSNSKTTWCSEDKQVFEKQR